MVLSYRAQGTGTYTVLGDDTTGAVPPLIMGFVPKMKGITKVTPLFRAANAQVVARNNRYWELRGIIETMHASYDAAADFIRSQALAIPDYIDLKIDQGATTIYLTPATFDSFEPSLTGQSSRIQYSFIASKITSTAP